MVYPFCTGRLKYSHSVGALMAVTGEIIHLMRAGRLNWIKART
jgi:hypothetical protein